MNTIKFILMEMITTLLSHSSFNFHENNYTTMTLPNQFKKSESGNHDPTKHVWGNPGAEMPQYSTIV